MRALAVAILAVSHIAAAESPKFVPMRAAVTAWVPGMSEADARRRARELGCNNDEPAGELICMSEQAGIEVWTLFFENDRLDRVEYWFAVDLDGLDDDAARTARREVDRRALALDIAADASGGTKTQADIASWNQTGYRAVWQTTKARRSKLQLAVWEDRGMADQYVVMFESVGRRGTFRANILFEAH